MRLSEITKNRLHYKKLESESELIEHAKTFSRNLKLDGVPISAMNRYPVVCSTLLSRSTNSLNESVQINAGNDVIRMMRNSDQFDSLNLKVGSKVAIINAQLQGDNLELWGFTHPKIITKIYRDPSEGNITQFEFNNDEDDVWPRTPNAEYNGNFLMYSSFFGDKKSATNCISLIRLVATGDLRIRSHITESETYQPPELKDRPFC